MDRQREWVDIVRGDACEGWRQSEGAPEKVLADSAPKGRFRGLWPPLISSRRCACNLPHIGIRTAAFYASRGGTRPRYHGAGSLAAGFLRSPGSSLVVQVEGSVLRNNEGQSTPSPHLMA